MDKILNFFEDLPTKRKIIILVIMCLLLGIITARLSDNKNSNPYTSSLKYKNITIDSLLENYTENYKNRDVYIQLETIVSELNSSYNVEKNIYKNYYSVLDDNYSKKISKGKFAEKANNIFAKIHENNNEFTMNLYVENDNSNTYIVEIITDTTIGYMGIILDPGVSTYSIFYIE